MSKITRQKRKENFTVINNDILQNSKLSWAAKGMLVYLLHLPDGWQINVADLSNRSKNGRDGTAGIIKELMNAGYISRVKIKNEKAQFKGYDYTVNDEPVNGKAVNGKAVNGLSVDGSSVNGKAVTSKDYQEEELSLLITNEEDNVELHSTVALIDEVDETSVEIHHVPDYFDTEQKKPKEKVAQKRKGKETTAEEMDLVFQVVQYLNEKTEQSFQPGGEKTKLLILARHHVDKWNLDDFKTVIDHKKSEWFAKDNLRQYLRPSTLFAAGHAEEYLQAAKLWKKKPVATSPGVVPLYRQENFANTDRSKFKF
jgi:uncharacterized phage protein (TIGR02220 family)